MSCGYDDDGLMVDSNGCFTCVEVPKVKGRFGLAWVSESPDCPRPEPVGWQVEFLDTPSKVEQKCQEMVRWINCPPLPRCEPCPPDELCSPCNPPRCNPCAPKCNPCLPKCPLPKCTCKPQQQQQKQCCCTKQQNSPKQSAPRKKCCCCCGDRRPKRNCYPPMGGPCCRARSPRRQSPVRCTCDSGGPKCTCDDIPVKDTNGAIGSSSGTYKANNNNCQSLYPCFPKQVTRTENPPNDQCCNCSKETLTIYQNHNDNQFYTDTEYSQNNNDKQIADPANNAQQQQHQKSNRSNDRQQQQRNAECKEDCQCPCSQKDHVSESHKTNCGCMDGAEDATSAKGHTHTDDGHQDHHQQHQVQDEDTEVSEDLKTHGNDLPDFNEDTTADQITSASNPKRDDYDHDHHRKSNHSQSTIDGDGEMEKTTTSEVKSSRASPHSQQSQQRGEHSEVEDQDREHQLYDPKTKKRYGKETWLSPILMRLCFKGKEVDGSRRNKNDKAKKHPEKPHDKSATNKNGVEHVGGDTNSFEELETQILLGLDN